MRKFIALLFVFVLVSCDKAGVGDSINYDCSGVDSAILASSFETCVNTSDASVKNCMMATKQLLCEFTPRNEKTDRFSSKSGTFPN